MAEAPTPLSGSELLELDATYRPFPGFAEWPDAIPREHVWSRRLQELEAARIGTDSAVLAKAFDVALRAAAWDTGAIEGLYQTTRGITLTIALQATAWQHEVAGHGAEASALFDAQLATYELVLDVATKAQPITQARIRRIHEELTRSQETYTVHTDQGPQEHPLPRGEYKRHPNHVQLPDGSRHAYAPVGATQGEMARLVDELTAEPVRDAHPLLQAAYAHYGFVAIHPFADGNGRVARALASIYLFRAARVPLVIFVDDRERYFDGLAAADHGDYAPLVSFIADAGIATLELVLDSLRAALAPSLDDGIRDLRGLLTAQGGLTYTDVDGVASNLLPRFNQILAEEIGKRTLPTGVQIQVASGSGLDPPVPDEYRPVLNPRGQYIAVTFTSPPPSQARRDIRFTVFVSRAHDEDADLFWLLQEETGIGAKFALNDLSPQLTTAAETRLRLLAMRVLGIEVAELLSAARQSLIESGYLETS